MTSRRTLRIAQTLFAIALFAFALTSLRNTLAQYRWRDFTTYLATLPRSHVVLAIAMTFGGYATMTGYDAFALSYIDRTIAYWRVALASFTGYAINNNVGLSGAVGMSLRYRMYSTWGLTAGEIARVFAFCTIAYWVGFNLLGAIVFIAIPPPLPPAFKLPFPSSIRILGVIMLITPVVYLLGVMLRKAPLRFMKQEVTLPKPPLVAVQLALAMADWILAAAVLWLLLPSPAQSFPLILAVFLLAQMGGLLSNVPGGIGVFEAIAIVFLKPQAIGALLAFRGIYFLLPLAIAIVILAAHAVGRFVLRDARANP